MNKNYILFGLGLLFILGLSIVSAYPNLNGQRVSDFANLLTSDEESQLTAQIYSMENLTGSQFAIVTVMTTEGDGRVNYAARIGDQNGVGVTGKDNGVVIMWSVDNERGGAIATGRGIGDILTDVTVTNIGKAHRSELDAGQFYIAFSGILTDLQNKLVNNSTITTTTEMSSILPQGLRLVLIVIGIVFIIMILAVITSSGNGGSGGSGGFAGGYVGSSGGWSSGSSGGGFSGGSFGGGGGGF